MGYKGAQNSYKDFFEVIQNQHFFKSGEKFRAADIRPAVDRVTIGKKLTTSSLHSIMRAMSDAKLVEMIENPAGRYYRKMVPKQVLVMRSEYFEFEYENGLAWIGQEVMSRMEATYYE
jgi:hypothetical protein